MRKLIILFFALLSTVSAQMAPQPLPEIEHLEGQNYLFCWEGVPERIYFIQTSSQPPSAEGFAWDFAPDIRIGYGEQIEMGFAATAENAEFFRLIYVDYSGTEDPDLADFDDDGYTNLEEAIENTDPFDGEAYPGSGVIGENGGGDGSGEDQNKTEWNHEWFYTLTHKIDGTVVKTDTISPINDLGSYYYSLNEDVETELIFENGKGDGNKAIFPQLEPNFDGDEDEEWTFVGVVELSSQNTNWDHIGENGDLSSPSGILLPVEIVIPKVDSNGNEVSGELVAANELKVSKMEQSLTVDKNAGQITKEELDIDNDIDRFYIRIGGGVEIADNKEVLVKLKTTKNTKVKYNDDETEIELVAEVGDLVSKSLMLTSDDVDDDFAGDVEIGTDDQKDDRTHIIQLGGDLVLSKIRIGDDEHELNLEKPVHKKKKVTVNFVILNDGNVNVANVNAEIERDLEVINERYAQVGIEVISGGIVVKAVPDGLTLPDGQLRVDKFGGDILSEDLKKVIEECGTAGNINDFHAFYSPHPIANKHGRTFDGVALNNFWDDDPNDAGFLSNVFLTIGQPWPSTLAHEIGHVLTDAGHVAVWQFDPGDPLQSKVQTNLMTDLVVNKKRIADTHRLWRSQGEVMKASHHSKNPD